MERWKKLNVYLGCCGILIFIVSMLFLKKVPLLLLSAMFGLGMFFKTFKIIYKGEDPPVIKKVKNPYDTRIKKKSK